MIDEKPGFVTRIALTPGAARHAEPGEVAVTYGGVCPEGHPVAEIPLDVIETECPECGTVYRIEDERHGKEV
jgi:hypothetical protein